MDDGGGLCVEGEKKVEFAGVFRCEGACAGERRACRKGPPAWCVAWRRFGGSQLYQLIIQFLIYTFVQGHECLYKLAIAELHAVVQTI